MAPPVLRFTVHIEEAPAVLVFLAKESDPSIIHAFAPLGDDTVRGMTREESRLVDHLLAQDTVNALCTEAIRVWPSWSDVETLVVVHNVIDPPERRMAEA